MKGCTGRRRLGQQGNEFEHSAAVHSHAAGTRAAVQHNCYHELP